MGLAAGNQLDPYSLMLLAGVIIVVTMVMISTRRRVADRGSSPRAYAREQIARLREQDEMRDDLQELMTQLEKLAREIGAQVDTRFAKLEKAIADADARLAELRRMGLGEAASVSEAPAASELGAAGGEEVRQLDSVSGDGVSAPADGTSSDGPSTGLAEDAPGPAADRDRFERQVLDLADAGKKPLEIARELGRDVGEVELIIKLKRRDHLS